MTDRLRANANLVDSLGSATRHGGSALADAPALLRRVLEEEAWREFITQRGDLVEHRSFSSFVTTPPLKGLGVDMALVERIVADEPEVQDMLREAQKIGKPGPAAEGEMRGDSPSISDDQTGKTRARLSRDHPEVYERVKAKELSTNAAAVLAGIRPRRISIRTDDAQSLARSLRKHLAPELLTQLRTLLDES